MTIPIRIGSLCLILVLLIGCSITRTYCSLKGNKEVKQSNHVVNLSVSTEDLSELSKTGNSFRGFATEGANCFVLTFVGGGSSVSVDTIKGSYQFYSEEPQPLELAYLNRSVAVFVPRAHILTKYSPKTLAHTGDMKLGRYKLDIQYLLNGSDYSCHFDVDYAVKTKFEYHDIRELGNVN